MTERALTVVAYHYVRDLPATRFPRIKGLRLDAFRRQLAYVAERFEMATLESALAFLAGRYRAERDLCLLTFDDGLKEHYTDVTPLLADAGVSGCFFPATQCLEGRVASVHKVHFLMAALDFDTYRRGFLDTLAAVAEVRPEPIARDLVAGAYPWDTPEVGEIKYLANFVLPPAIRDRVVDRMFGEYLGDETAFASELYVDWDELRQMQDAGMVIGGHSHQHLPLPSLDDAALAADIARNATELQARLRPQPLWPFAYPYGRHDAASIAAVREHGFACGFTVEAGSNAVSHDRFRLRRFDTNQIPSPSGAVLETAQS
jgi:peptidoglycan/xylan/chitin deacetylase (PgdA/CDA1 family)